MPMKSATASFDQVQSSEINIERIPVGFNVIVRDEERLRYMDPADGQQAVHSGIFCHPTVLFN